MRFDNNYFKNVMQLKGLLKLDNALYLDPRTNVYVEKFANENTKKPLNDMASLTGKNLTELMNHISDQFVKASKSGEDVSMILETQISQDLNDMKGILISFN